MADTSEKINACIEKALNYLSGIGHPIILKNEQMISIQHLLLNRDVIAILPTGFGKSMIFTVYALAKREMIKMAGNVNNDGCSVLVISPLKSIISDQISYLQSINNTAVEMSNKTFVDIVRSPPQFIYATAEQVIDQKFLKEMKSMTSILHRSIVAVVVDESHTVETWGAKRYLKLQYLLFAIPYVLILANWN